MAERSRPPLRLVVAAVLLVLGLVEVQSVVQSLRAQARLRARVIHGLESPLIATWPEIARLFRPGGEESWERAIDRLTALSPSAESEVFDLTGRALYARPAKAPVQHWPNDARLQSLATGVIMTFGPVAGSQSRMLTYAAFPSGDGVVVLRLASAVPELIEDLRERQALLVGHAVVLVLLVVASALVFFPERSPGQGAGSLEAYAAALTRLREHGEAATSRHDAERLRLTGEVRDLEAMARAGELTAGMVHEVRNGLGTILGYARLLEQQARTPEAEAWARGIREECETLETVVRRFMDFVRRETLHLGPFDVTRMLRRVAARESSAHPVRDLVFSGRESLAVTGDEGLLERAFENLVRNALEAAGPEGRVVLDVEEQPDAVRVAIADDGPGVPAQIADAFRPFVSSKSGGLGLGLSIAQKIVRLHGGAVRLVATAPRGTRAEVTLARVAIVAEGNAEPGGTRDEPTGPGNLNH